MSKTGAENNEKSLSAETKTGKTPGVHSVHGDIVEIERNMIENWLLTLRHWVHANPATVRYFIISLIAATLLVFTAIFVHSYLQEKNNQSLFSLIETFEQNQKINDQAAREKAFLELAGAGEDLCAQIWRTASSKNGCLVAAMAYQQTANSSKAAENLRRFNSFWGNRGATVYTRFFEAYAYESAYELDKAAKIYGELESDLKKIERADIGLYHRARILYLQGKMPEARALFDTLLKEYPTSNYLQDARHYLLLISSLESK